MPHHSKRWSVLRSLLGSSALPSVCSRGLYSRLGVVTTSMLGCKAPSMQGPSALRGSGSRCSTTSTRQAHWTPFRSPQAPAESSNCEAPPSLLHKVPCCGAGNQFTPALPHRRQAGTRHTFPDHPERCRQTVTLSAMVSQSYASPVCAWQGSSVPRMPRPPAGICWPARTLQLTWYNT